MASKIKIVIIDLKSRLYSALLPQTLGRRLKLCWRTSRAFHPSEDLSELPPLLETVAGQEYHCRLTGSLRNSPPQAAFWPDKYRSSPCLAVFDGGFPPQVSLRASSIAACRSSKRSVSVCISVAGYEIFKVDENAKNRPHCIGSESCFFISSFQKKFNFFETLRNCGLCASPLLSKLVLIMAFQDNKCEQL